MATETEFKPRIVSKKVELWVPDNGGKMAFVGPEKIELRIPHNGGEIAFALPADEEINSYRYRGEQILKNGQKVPVGDYTASLLHAVCCCRESGCFFKPEIVEIRERACEKLWVFNVNLWAKKGVYVVQDEDARGLSSTLHVGDLEKRLKRGKEILGVRFSRDGKVRFAPKKTCYLYHDTPREFADDGFIIASFGLEGAKKLGEVVGLSSYRPDITPKSKQEWGHDVFDVRPEGFGFQTVSSIRIGWRTLQLYFDGFIPHDYPPILSPLTRTDPEIVRLYSGYELDDYPPGYDVPASARDYCRAFGVLKHSLQAKAACAKTESKKARDTSLDALISHASHGKYIIVRLTRDGEQKSVLVSSQLRHHSDIYNSIRGMCKGGKTMEVLGGGILDINHRERAISTYGKSGCYGEPDKHLVKRILEKAYPDYTLDVRVTEYVED